MIRFSGATPVPMQLLEEKDYHPDLDDLASKITDRTRLIIVNSPENPCGSALGRDELEDHRQPGPGPRPLRHGR